MMFGGCISEMIVLELSMSGNLYLIRIPLTSVSEHSVKILAFGKTPFG